MLLLLPKMAGNGVVTAAKKAFLLLKMLLLLLLKMAGYGAATATEIVLLLVS
jgi:hypothetical protein